MSKPDSDSVCAIIVTFEPDLAALGSLLQRLDDECDFIVVDNGSSSYLALSTLTGGLGRCQKFLRQEENLGLAAGLNVGIRWAINAGVYDNVLLFDQDSLIENGFVAAMLAAMECGSRLSKRQVAAVGPRIVNPRSGRGMPFKLFDRLWRRSDRLLPASQRLYLADFLISSGTLIALRSLSGIGLMKEAYFIDNVDLEWCFRARAQGFQLLGTSQARLHHVIGEPGSSLPVRLGLMVEHSPLRSFYSTRNRAHLWRCDYAPWGWKLRDRPRFVLKALWLMLFSNRRLEYWHNITSGLNAAGSMD